MSLQILWDEYRASHPDGYGYSRFCDLFREFEHRLSPVMRQHHVAGEKAFVDYSGKRVPIVDPRTGEIGEVELFVGVLGASNLTFATLTATQKLHDWIGAHVRLFVFLGGVPIRLRRVLRRAQGRRRPAVHPPLVARPGRRGLHAVRQLRR
ncbi:hypothetical protein [Reyranella sp.]